MLSFLKHWAFSLLKVSKCYHFRMLSFGVIIYFMLSFNVIIFWCYHLMLSFDVIICVIIWCYHLFYVIIWCYQFSQFANVIIFLLTFFLVQDGCYHLRYHLRLSFFVIISTLFSFSWKRDTLQKEAANIISQFVFALTGRNKFISIENVKSPMFKNHPRRLFRPRSIHSCQP